MTADVLYHHVAPLRWGNCIRIILTDKSKVICFWIGINHEDKSVRLRKNLDITESETTVSFGEIKTIELL